VQPLTVTVLALDEPGPPAVEDELDTLPPPAWICTDDPPAELELDSAPLETVEPVVPEPDEDRGDAAVSMPFHRDPAGVSRRRLAGFLDCFRQSRAAHQGHRRDCYH